MSFKREFMRVIRRLSVRSIQGAFRRYAVRKGSVRITKKSCYIVCSHHILLLNGQIFTRKHNKRDIQSKESLNSSSACFARVV